MSYDNFSLCFTDVLDMILLLTHLLQSVPHQLHFYAVCGLSAVICLATIHLLGRKTLFQCSLECVLKWTRLEQGGTTYMLVHAWIGFFCGLYRSPSARIVLSFQFLLRTKSYYSIFYSDVSFGMYLLLYNENGNSFLFFLIGIRHKVLEVTGCIHSQCPDSCSGIQSFTFLNVKQYVDLFQSGHVGSGYAF